MTNKDKAIALGVVFVWGINFLFMKLALDSISPAVLGMLRFACLSFPALFFLKKPPIAWRWLILYGLTMSFGQFGFMFLALSMGVPTGLSALVHQSQVFFTVLLVVMVFGEHIKPNHLIGMVLAGVGLGMIGVGQYQGGLALVGLLVVMSGSLSWAVGNVIIKKLSTTHAPISPVSLVVWGNLSALVAFTLLSFGLYGTEGVVSQVSHLNPIGWVSVLYLAYVASLFGYAGWGDLLSRYPASQVTPLALLVPVFALITGFVVLDERLGLWHWGGILVVMTALMIHVFGFKLPSKNTP